MESLLAEITKAAERRRDEEVSFLRELVRTPSPSGKEAEAAGIVAEKMRSVGFDNVRVDSLNDVMATLRGGGGRSLLLNGHIDHVPPGDMVDPYSGALRNGAPFGVEGEVVYGRGASDMKGAVAAMVMAGAILGELGVELGGDLRIAAVAQEEVGGAGTMATIQEGHLLGDVAIIGEATGMELALGHRGSMKMSVVVKGRSCHASAPERGINALYNAADLIARIRSELMPRLPDHPVHGQTTLAVTRIGVKPGAANVVPEECEFTIDCRNGPDYPEEALKGDLEALIDEMRSENPEFEALVLPANLVRGMRGFTGFYTDLASNPVVSEVRGAVSEALRREPRLITWRFYTDGCFYARLGIPVVGFGPGEERFAHTNQDHVRVDDLEEAVKTYAWLACRICGVERKD